MLASQSAVNIAVRVTAAQALKTLNALNLNLQKIEISGMGAGTVLDAIAGASAGVTAGLRGASVEAALLARNLALISKSGGPAAKRLVDVGVGAELAGPAMLTASVSAAALSRVMGPLAVQSAVVANSLRTLATVSNTSAVAQAKADAIRQASADKSAASQILAAEKVRAARAKTDAAVKIADNAVVASDSKVAASAARTSAEITAAQAKADAARERSAAVAASSAAAIAAANSRAAASAASTAAAGSAGALGGAAAGAAGAAASRGLMGIGGGIDQASEKMRSFGSKTQWTGRQLAVNFTAPLLLAGGAAIKWGNDQEKAWTMVRKVYGDGSQEQLAQSDQVRQKLDMLSTTYGKNREDIYTVAEAWASLGMTGGSLANATQTTVEAAVMGNMSLEKSTEGLIAIQAQFKLTTTEAKTALMEMNAIANQGPLELGPLIDGMARSGSAARDAGLSVSQLAGLLETLSPATGTATTAGNGLRSILASIIAPSSAAAGEMEKYGFTLQKWQDDAVPVIDRIKEMGNVYTRMDADQKIAFDRFVVGKFQLQRFGEVLSTINDENGEFAKAMRATADSVTDSSGKLVEGSNALKVWNSEMQIVMESDPQKFAQMWQQIKNSLVDAFKPMVPILLNIVLVIAQMFKWFAALPDPVKKFAIYALALLAVIGPFIMVGASLVLLLGSLGTGFVWAAAGVAAFGSRLLWVFSKGTMGTMPTMFAKLSMLFSIFQVHVGLAGMRIAAIWTAMWSAIVTRSVAGSALVSRIWLAFWGKSWKISAGGAAANSGIIGKLWTWILSTYSRGVGLVSRLWGMLWVSKARASATGAAANSGIIQLFFARLGMLYSGALTALAGLWAKFWVTKGRVSAGGAAANSGIIQVFFARLAVMYTTGTAALAARWAALQLFMARATATGAVAVALRWDTLMLWMQTAMIPMVRNVAAMMMLLMTNLGRIIAMSAMTLVRTLVVPIVSAIGTAVAAIAAFLGIPVWAVLAIIAVVALAIAAIVKWRTQIWDAIKAIGRWFAQLPGVIGRALVGAWKAIVEVGKRIRQSLSDAFNPWQRHSPSLVDNVQSGTDAIISAYANAGSVVRREMQDAKDAVAAFSKTSAGLTANAEQVKFDENRAKIGEVDPGSLGLFDNLRNQQKTLQAQIDTVNRAVENQKGVVTQWQDRIKLADKDIESLNKRLAELQKVVDRTSEALSAAKSQLEEFSNAQITGTRAASDAIFENEMAQKRLRLEIMRLEETGGAIDDIRDKYQRLQGDIETLTGRREELRAGGAGSDILATYDKMIADLRKQQGNLAQGGTDKISKAQDALKKLQDQAEKMDLENSLKFDPLNRQIERMTSNVKEMPFGVIVAGITASKAAVEAATTANERATTAYNEQKTIIDAATEARDSMNDQMSTEQDRLDALVKIQDELKEAYDSVTEAMNVAVQAADTLIEKQEAAAKAAEKGEEAVDGLGSALDSLGDPEIGLPDPESLDLEKWAEEFENTLNAEFEGISLNPFKDVQWGEMGKTIIRGIGKAFGGADLEAEFAKAFQPGTGGIDWGPWIVGGERGQSWGDFFTGVWNDMVGGVVTALMGKDIGVIFRNGIEEGSGGIDWSAIFLGTAGDRTLIGSVVDFFGIATQWGKDIINGLGQGISDILADPWKWVAEHITGPIGDAFKSLFGIHSPSTVFAEWGGDMIRGLGEGLANTIQGVLDWFAALPQRILDALGDLGAWLGGKFSEALAWVRDHLPEWAQGIFDWFVNLPQNTVNAIGDLGSWLGGKFSDALGWVRDHLPEWAQGIFDWFVNLPGNVVGALGDARTWLVETGKNVLEGLFDGMGGFIDKLKRWVADKVPSAIRGPVESALGIHSPSRVFMGIGRNVGEGLILGLQSKQDGVMSAAQTLADQVGSVVVPNMKLDNLTKQSTSTPSVAGGAALSAAPKLDPISQAPTQTAALAQGAQQAMTAYQTATGGQLTSIKDDYATVFETIKTDTVGKVTEMTNGQLLVTGTGNAALTAQQAAYSVTAVAGQTLLKDNIIGVQSKMAAGLSAVTAASGADLTKIMSGTRDSLGGLATDTNQIVSGQFDNMSANLASTFNDGIAPVFAAFGPMLDQTAGWFSSTVENIGGIWSGIQGQTAEPARFVINRVYNDGIKSAWNNVNGWLGLAPLPDFVAPFETGGLVNRANLVNPRTPRSVVNGGKLSGTSTGDKTLFAGKGGEYVLTEKMTKDVGLGRLEAWRRAANSGKSTEGAASTFLEPVLARATGGPIRPGVIDEVYKQLQGKKNSPYDYGGGGGTRGYDCSGWTGAVHKILTGGSPVGRIWTTESNFPSFGYKRGKDGYWSMGVHNGGGGMNSHTAGTLDGTNFESGGAHNTSTWGGPAAGTIHPQFENQWYLPELGGVFQGTAGGGSGPSMLQRVEEAYKAVMDPIKSMVPSGPGGMGAFPGQAMGKFDTDVWGFLSGKAGEYDAANASMGNIAYDLTAGVEQWRGTVKQALGMLGLPLSLDETVLRRMQQESSGNPNAINLTDSNAMAGTPSKGLMQVIDPTFLAHKMAGYDNIWAPLDNILASLRYAQSRYGSVEAAYNQSGGYDDGGLAVGKGFLAKNVIAPERVLDPRETVAFENLIPLASKLLNGGGAGAVSTASAIDIVAQGVTEAFTGASSNQVGRAITGSSLDALDGWAQSWDPLFYDATANASNAVATSTDKVASATDKVASTLGIGLDGMTKSLANFTAIGEQISGAVSAMVVLAQASIAGSQGEEIDWGAVGGAVNGLLSAGAGLLQMIPDQQAEYWSEVDTTNMTPAEKKAAKAALDSANIQKGMLQFVKDAGPSILNGLGSIAAGVGTVVTTMAPLIPIAAAMAATGNIAGAALALLPGILTSILTLVPLIIQAITQIVPALITAIIKFFAGFMPGAERAYADYASASEAAAGAQAKNEASTAKKASDDAKAAAGSHVADGDKVTVNLYGDISMPNVRTAGDASEIIDYLASIPN